ncbi:hypothetical protein [Bradyrhizobium sp. AZCC 1578]|uniref:hypothetical protein n=1 Tax=Bradyrhizobium sp. AZCC 1578 TaxID=3117027 RepID=UPI002FF024BF
MEKLAASIGRKTVVTPSLDPQDEMPDEHWHAVLNDAQVETRSSERSSAGQRLSEIAQHVLRVSCRRCERIVEIQKADAIRLYGQQASWREVGQRLLNNTCQNRTGRHEEDGCWSAFEPI